MRQRVIAAAVVALFALAAALILLTPEAEARRADLAFDGPSGLLSGDLILPEGAGPHPALILVHGDGPAPRDGFGYYAAWRGALARAGYATLSLDKPGVGASEGDWLAQSMGDRARELREAAAYLRKSGLVDPDRIGLLSFSQGVWPAAAAAASGDFAFLVSVSGPLSWMRQSRALTHARLAAAQAGPEQAARALACDRLVETLLEARAPHRAYLREMQANPDCGAPMEVRRWGFVLRNHSSDATAHFTALRMPVLGLFGALDGNLDPQAEAADLRAALAQGDPRSEVRVIAGAGHALTPEDTRRVADGAVSVENLLLLGRALLLEEGALSDGVVAGVVEWLDRATGARP